jgi:hypothetical protein
LDAATALAQIGPVREGVDHHVSAVLTKLVVTTRRREPADTARHC